MIETLNGVTIDMTNVDTYILNENNKYITKEYINSVLEQYGICYKIKNLPTFQLAMVHTSYLKVDVDCDEKTLKKRYNLTKETDIEPIKDASKAIQLRDNSYERLEFLGDSIIRAILSDYLFCRYKTEAEGFMTKLRTKIENGESLAKLTKVLKLNEYVMISRYLDSKGGRQQNLSILEDIYESFMGALYMEAGFDLCKKFMITMVEKEIDIADLLHHDTNYKDMLLQLYHKKKWTDPKYGTLNQSGIENKKEFTMYVKDNSDSIIGIGVGTSKKKGQQEAAKQALIKLGFFDTCNLESESDSECDYECSKSDVSDAEYSDSSGSYVYDGTESD